MEKHATSYSNVKSDDTKRLPNGYTLIDAKPWRGDRPRHRVVLAGGDGQFATWEEYQQADMYGPSQPYTCHGHYFPTLAEALADFEARH